MWLPKNANDLRTLHAAARSHHLQPSYINTEGQIIWAEPQTLTFLLRELANAEINSLRDLQQIIATQRQSLLEMGVEPTQAIWKGQSPVIRIYLSEDELDGPGQLEIFSEDGITRVWAKPVKSLKAMVPIPRNLDVGYWKLQIQTVRRTLQSLLIIAPHRLSAPKDLPEKSWGVFAPLYALKSNQNWGMGNYSDYRKLAQAIKPYGGRFIGSLPLLAADYSTPNCDPSPYNAWTRLFWNEYNLDLEALAQRMDSARAQKMIAQPSFQREIQRLRECRTVDYHGVHKVMTPILSQLAQEFFSSGAAHKKNYRTFKNENPDLLAYAQFRAQGDTDLERRHLFAQYQVNGELNRLSRTAQVGLYLDFPIGVNERGFDFHRYRESFFNSVTVGAPPEKIFQLGQEWGFPSFHPYKIRESGYLYFRRALANHLRFAKILRLDHVMGLHRVFVVPKGHLPKEGAYLRFKPDELFAIACLEADRHRADLIGENLGTVPSAVEKTMSQRHIPGMWVFQERIEKAPAAPPKNSLVCLNTHDMPMFRQFISGDDLFELERLKILGREFVSPLKEGRQLGLERWMDHLKAKSLQDGSHSEFFERLISYMARSRARYLLVNLEDIWGETKPQNIPGTFKEVPNWRRKFALSLSEWKRLPATIRIFTELKKVRG